MKNSEWLKTASMRLGDAGIESARLDALLLLEDLTGKNRAHLLAHPELELTAEQEKLLDSLLNQRIRHVPLAYVRGKAAFYGHEFMVNNHVLVPRPESETIIELLLEYGETPTIIDVGTGSGALAISAKLARPLADVIALDIDSNCLEVARGNAKSLNASIDLLESDMLRRLDFDMYRSPIVILANLPYVPDDYEINAAAKHEPSIALFGGKDGLDPYRILFDQLSEYEDTEMIVLTESLEFQHTSLEGIARNFQFTATGKKGLVQTFCYTP